MTGASAEMLDAKVEHEREPRQRVRKAKRHPARSRRSPVRAEPHAPTPLVAAVENARRLCRTDARQVLAIGHVDLKSSNWTASLREEVPLQEVRQVRRVAHVPGSVGKAAPGEPGGEPGGFRTCAVLTAIGPPVSPHDCSLLSRDVRRPGE